jgi:hypothetical protein
VCGLVGVTFLRIDSWREVVPLWIGTIAGVGLGQLFSWARVRAWLPVVIAIGACWVLFPFLLFAFTALGETAIETFFLAFFPSAVCGYLSLSERGGLVAFWFPAMLWMVVILDGGGAKTELPFVIGLGVLFVAFLHAREARRVAIWQESGTPAIAKAREPAVMRASPLRAASQVAWSGLMGAMALVLAAWIAPHLWQKERDHAATQAQAQPANPWATQEAVDSDRCCPISGAETERERVSEYLPLKSAQATQVVRPTACKPCYASEPITRPYGSGDQVAAAEGWTYTTPTDMPPPGSLGGSSELATSTPMTVPTVTPTATTTAPATATATAKPVAPKPTTVATTAPPPKPTTTTTAQAPVAKTSQPTTAIAVVRAAPPPPSNTDTGSPWRWTLGACVAAILLHMGARALRRALTLHHLADPFWRETIDQRVSNHWQRMLIGLRDAGITPTPGEQPLAFARRIGIESATTCATILERVRHGARIDATDLDAMSAAATDVFYAARRRAGFVACAAAHLRWPLA